MGSLFCHWDGTNLGLFTGNKMEYATIVSKQIGIDINFIFGNKVILSHLVLRWLFWGPDIYGKLNVIDVQKIGECTPLLYIGGNTSRICNKIYCEAIGSWFPILNNALFAVFIAAHYAALCDIRIFCQNTSL